MNEIIYMTIIPVAIFGIFASLVWFCGEHKRWAKRGDLPQFNIIINPSLITEKDLIKKMRDTLGIQP